MQRQGNKQIPKGNDRKKSKDNGRASAREEVEAKANAAGAEGMLSFGVLV
jgi:hypothetical protein